MTASILAFEWRYHTRQVSFAAAVLLFFTAGFVLASTGFGPDNVNVNSPYAIAESIGFVSLLAVFAAAVFSASAVVRDRELRMEEIVFSTSVEKLPFLAGRFGGSVLAAFTAFSTSTLGMLAGRLMPWQESSRLGPIRPFDYLQPLFTIGLPNVLFAGIVLFAVATITRSVLASYAAAVFVYVLYFVASALTNSPLMAASVPGAAPEGSVAGLLDPFALSAFFEATRYWTPAARNARLLPLAGDFLANRLLWIAVSAAGFALVYRLFSFRVSRGASVEAPAEEIRPDVAPRYAPIATQANWFQAFASAAKLECRAAIGNRPFLALALLWAGLAASEIMAEVTGGELGSAFYPTTALIAATVRQPLSLIGMVLIVFYSAELVWRERAVRFAEIVDATPARNTGFILAKWVALAVLSLVLTSIAFMAGAVVQVTRGYPLEPGLMAGFALLEALPLVLFAAVAILVQTLSPQKYLGMLLVLGAGVLAQRADVIGLEHPLLRFSSLSQLEWSAFNSFAPFAARWGLLALYWASLAALALSGAAAVRRRERPRVTRLPAVVFTITALVSAALVFRQTNVVERYETESEVLQWKADYEKAYGRYAAMAVPRVREVRGRIDLEPERRRYRVQGEYALVNEGSAPIHTVLVVVRRDASRTRIAVDQPAEVVRDERFGQYVVKMKHPLAPGAALRLRFDVLYERNGFGAPGEDAIVANGSYIMGFRSLPTIGYRRGYEIADQRERRRHGLAAVAHRGDGEGEVAGGDWATFDVTISTAPDQLVIAPGRLVRAWSERGRRFFRYRSDAPIPNQFAISSARYAVARQKRDGVTVEVYYHPQHAANVQRIVRAASESLRLFRERFGPYPFDTLRIAEVPLYWNFGGFAQPGVIFLQEQRAFLIDSSRAAQFDLLYRRVAHEVAHQWWGHQLVAAQVPGALMLTESLAKYSELLALGQAYGEPMVVRSLEAEHDLYLAGRTGEAGTEPPLTRVENQSYLYYRKGAIVMFALRELLGERVVDGALRDLLRERGGPGGTPLAAHLVAKLEAAASPHDRALIDEWLGRVVLYDLKVSAAEARRLSAGGFEVRIVVDASKTGNGTLDDTVRLAVWAADGRKILYDGTHAIVRGRNDIVVSVDEAPAIAVLDPAITRIDVNRVDNSRRVELH